MVLLTKSNFLGTWCHNFLSRATINSNHANYSGNLIMSWFHPISQVPQLQLMFPTYNCCVLSIIIGMASSASCENTFVCKPNFAWLSFVFRISLGQSFSHFFISKCRSSYNGSTKRHGWRELYSLGISTTFHWHICCRLDKRTII